MPTLTGQNTRTITGYVVTLLDYPRWIIEREVDFTDCHLSGSFDADDKLCDSCSFGQACCWLNKNRTPPSLQASLPELLQALGTAVEYLRSTNQSEPTHRQDCDCDSCQWLREAVAFLRTHRHHR
ncbi:MAG: hypothetical protein ACR2QI_10610 [Woeseiaceae bacterium]